MLGKWWREESAAFSLALLAQPTAYYTFITVLRLINQFSLDYTPPLSPCFHSIFLNMLRL